MVLWANLNYFHPLILILGVGDIKPNDKEDNEDEEPKELADEAWMKLLNEDDGVYSLKPWKEVKATGANSKAIKHACREIVRQAWSECYTIV
jgi:hypothetical protein